MAYLEASYKCVPGEYLYCFFAKMSTVCMALDVPLLYQGCEENAKLMVSVKNKNRSSLACFEFEQRPF